MTEIIVFTPGAKFIDNTNESSHIPKVDMTLFLYIILKYMYLLFINYFVVVKIIVKRTEI